MPGEFEPQDAVWLGWQEYETYYEVNINMVKTLLPYVGVKIATESDSMKGVANRLLFENGIDTSKIQFYVFPDNEFWMRDHGAAFTRNDKGALKVVDFEWCSYGYREWLLEKYLGNQSRVDSILSSRPASMLGKVDSLMGLAEEIEVEKSWIRIEGGAIEVNGAGSLLLNEPLTLSRNTGFSKDSISKEFKRVLGVSNIVWLQEGLAEDPHLYRKITDNYVGLGTGGHTDEYVRFADKNTILLAWIPEEEKDENALNRINYERMSINFDILSKAKNENGGSFKIIKVPLPEIIVKPISILEKGEWDENMNIPISAFIQKDNLQVGDTVLRVASASYLNFYVTNGLVLLPTYTSQGTNANKEEQVKEIFASAFPGRKIAFMDAMALNWEGGGIHCGTQQQPKRKR